MCISAWLKTTYFNDRLILLAVIFLGFVEFHNFVMDETILWMEVAMERLLYTEAPLYVMHYERLVKDPIKELIALLGFLG